MIPRTFIASALALAVTLPMTPAQAAGAPRTFLSAAGSDSNNCANVATPCRHLATAFAATAADGEIYVLDPANYGSLTIDHGVSIEGHGWASIAPASGGNAITINANPGDKINIIGVVLDGTALTGTTGIEFSSGGRLTVENSVIRNFQSGIDAQVNSSTPSQLFVSDTLISDNRLHAINVGVGGSSTVGVALSHLRIEGNSDSGLSFVNGAAGAAMNVTVSDSVLSGNGGDGIVATASVGSTSVMVRNCTISRNSSNGVEALFGNATIWLTRTSVTGNGAGWNGAVFSFGDNDIIGNSTVNNAPSAVTHE
jgi:Right handed beta helix region